MQNEALALAAPASHLEIKLRQTTKLAQKPFIVRDYQTEAAKRWFMDGKPAGGHGVVVLPCGAGKTIVALKTMSLVNTHTLILATNAAAVDQWVREILDKTHLTPDQVGAYMGERKEIRPVTVATYQILTWRRNKGDEFEHLHLFSDRDWGLIIYDEVRDELDEAVTLHRLVDGVQHFVAARLERLEVRGVLHRGP